MEDLDEIILKIQSFIKEYEGIRQTQNINAILDVKEKILAWSFRFAELVADLKISYNDQYFIRKINIAKTSQSLIKGGSKIGAAESAAMVKHEEAYREEQVTEGLAHKADIMLRQTNMIIRAIEQKVSYLKFEKNETRQ